MERGEGGRGGREGEARGGRRERQGEGGCYMFSVLCTPQLTALVTSFYLTLSQNYIDTMFLRQIREIGFLAHFESLLSSVGKTVLLCRWSILHNHIYHQENLHQRWWYVTLGSILVACFTY